MTPVNRFVSTLCAIVVAPAIDARAQRDGEIRARRDQILHEGAHRCAASRRRSAAA